MFYVIAIFILQSAISFAATPLDWKKVSSQRGPDGYRQITFSGISGPNARIAVDLENVILVKPDPSDDMSSSTLKFPAMLPDYMKMRPVGEVSRARTVAKACDVRTGPKVKAPKKGRIAKGKSIRAKTVDGGWVQFLYKKKTYYLLESCLAPASESEANLVKAQANGSGEFFITLKLPLGTLQIPVDVNSVEQSSSFVVQVEVNDTEPASPTEEAPPVAESEEIEEPKAASGSRNWRFAILVGQEMYSYEQKLQDGRNSSFKNSGISYGFELGWTGISNAFLLRFDHAQRSLKLPTPATKSVVDFSIDRWQGIFSRSIGSSKWRYRLGAEMRSGPLVLLKSGAFEVAARNTNSLIGGVSANYGSSPKWQNGIFMDLLYPIGASGFGGNFGASTVYRVTPRMFLGGELLLNYMNHTLDSRKRTITDQYFGIKSGMEF